MTELSKKEQKRIFWRMFDAKELMLRCKRDNVRYKEEQRIRNKFASKRRERRLAGLLRRLGKPAYSRKHRKRQSAIESELAGIRERNRDRIVIL